MPHPALPTHEPESQPTPHLSPVKDSRVLRPDVQLAATSEVHVPAYCVFVLKWRAFLSCSTCKYRAFVG